MQQVLENITEQGHHIVINLFKVLEKDFNEFATELEDKIFLIFDKNEEQDKWNYTAEKNINSILINLSLKTIKAEMLMLLLLILKKPRNFKKDNKKIKNPNIKLGLVIIFKKPSINIRLEDQAQRLQPIFNSIYK